MPTKNILVVDDNPSIRFVIRSLVEAAGFTVCGEAGGIEGIEKAQQVNPDLILLDLSMPRMTGAEAAPILKSQMPHVPIILFTLHDDTMGKALVKLTGGLGGSPSHIGGIVSVFDGQGQERGVLSATDFQGGVLSFQFG
jgi:CheY-like chemotaxis protein